MDHCELLAMKADRPLLNEQVHKRGNPWVDVAETEANPFRESIDYTFAGRIRSGVRLDGITFEVEPAQMFGLYELDDTTNPDAVFGKLIALDTPRARHTDAIGTEWFTKIDVFGLYVGPKDADAGESDRPTFTRDENNRIAPKNSATIVSMF